MMKIETVEWYQDSLRYITQKLYDIADERIPKDQHDKEKELLAGHLRYLATKLEKEK